MLFNLFFVYTSLRRLEGQITLRCYGIKEIESSKGIVLKFACDDGINFINVTAFDKEVAKVRSIIHVNELFMLENSGVKTKNPAYCTGTFGNYEIIVQGSSSVRTTVLDAFSTVPYHLSQWKSILDAKELPDNTVVGENNTK